MWGEGSCVYGWFLKRSSLAGTFLGKGLYGLQCVYTQKKVPQRKTYPVAQIGSFCCFLTFHPNHARHGELPACRTSWVAQTDATLLLQPSSMAEWEANYSENTEKGVMGNFSLPVIPGIDDIECKALWGTDTLSHTPNQPGWISPLAIGKGRETQSCPATHSLSPFWRVWWV